MPIIHMASRINAKLGEKAPPLPVIIAWIEALMMILSACQSTPEKALKYLKLRKAFRTRRIEKEMDRQWANYETQDVDYSKVKQFALDEFRKVKEPDMRAVYASLPPATTAG